MGDLSFLSITVRSRIKNSQDLLLRNPGNDSHKIFLYVYIFVYKSEHPVVD
jgi:hypothetical protein